MDLFVAGQTSQICHSINIGVTNDKLLKEKQMAFLQAKMSDVKK